MLNGNSFVDKVIIWTNSFNFINCCECGEDQVKGILHGMQPQPRQPFLMNHFIGLLVWVLKPLAEQLTVNSGAVHVPIRMYSRQLLQGKGTWFTKHSLHLIPWGQSNWDSVFLQIRQHVALFVSCKTQSKSWKNPFHVLFLRTMWSKVFHQLSSLFYNFLFLLFSSSLTQVGVLCSSIGSFG